MDKYCRGIGGGTKGPKSKGSSLKIPKGDGRGSSHKEWPTV